MSYEEIMRQLRRTPDDNLRELVRQRSAARSKLHEQFALVDKADLARLEAENAALREIAEAVLTYYWNADEDYCMFCASTEWEGQPEHHTKDCPVIKARALLHPDA